MRWSVPRLLFLQIVFLQTVVCGFNPAFAEPRAAKDKFDAIEIEEAPSLPQNAPSAAPTIIDSTNATAYRKILSPELYPLLKAGVISFEAFARTRYDWNFGTDWTAAEKGAAARSLGDGHTFCPECRTVVGLPFGDLDAIKATKAPEDQAHKVLWNTAAAQSEFPVQRRALSFLWYKQGKFYRELHADLLRIFPARVPEMTSGTQLFRERLNFTEPKSIAPLSFFSLRFLGADEDFLWEFSPAIGKSRELTGANRSDSLLGMPVSLDDLLVWSGKHEAIDTDGMTAATVLVPVSGLNPLALAPVPDNCVAPQGLALKTGGDTAQLNTTVQQWVNQGRSPWSILSELSFAVPRPVWRIELASTDPFSVYGRQVLTVDQESMLPLMNLVYDRSGHPWKLVLASTIFAATLDDARRMPLYPLTLVHDYLKDETVLVREVDSTFCDNVTPKISADAFDLKLFSEQGASASSSSAPAKPTAVSAPVSGVRD